MAEDEKALFRYRVIAPLCDPDILWGDKQNVLKGIAAKVYQLPGGKERQFSVETIRSWNKCYRKHGFAGLKTTFRADKGRCRALTPEIAKKACELKQENPRRTLIKVIDILEQEKISQPGVVTKSTLHRLFVQQQLTDRIPTSKAYWQRYQAQFSNDLWQSDQMHGPEIVDPKNPERTIRAQLLAWIDDHSRLICHAQFYPQAQLGQLEHSLRKAIQKMGVPKMIYTDNGQIYAAKHLGTVCAHLGVRLIYAKPYCPQGKGKVERFFGHVRSSFMTEVESSPIRTLEALNQAFWAWLELKYQQRVHSEIEKTPLEAFLPHQERIRRVSLDQIREAFLYREPRKVHKDCTFTLGGNYYEVMPALVKQEIEIQYDPDNMEEVKVYLAGTFFQQAKLLRVPPRRPKKEMSPTLKVDTGVNYLERLVTAHQQQQNIELFGPPVSIQNHLVESLVGIMGTLGFTLSEFDRAAVVAYDQQLVPSVRPHLASYLSMIVALKGFNHHIQFYLDKLTEIYTQGGLSHEEK